MSITDTGVLTTSDASDTRAVSVVDTRGLRRRSTSDFSLSALRSRRPSPVPAGSSVPVGPISLQRRGRPPLAIARWSTRLRLPFTASPPAQPRDRASTVSALDDGRLCSGAPGSGSDGRGVARLARSRRCPWRTLGQVATDRTCRAHPGRSCTACRSFQGRRCGTHGRRRAGEPRRRRRGRGEPS